MVQRKVHHLGKFFVAVIILIIVPILIFLSYEDRRNVNTLPLPEEFISIPRKAPSFLINTTKCKIPDLDPFNNEVLPFVKLEKYEPCSDKPLLSYIETKDDVVRLKINQSVIPLYSRLSISCCYSKILRKEGDRTVEHSDCEWFENEIRISYQYIRVTCKNFFGIIYRNVHAIIIPDAYQNKTGHKNSTNSIKIFMLGIDSISKLNLQRTMPNLFSYLEQNFVSFRGYNKIADNTFPNLMAILTGRDMDTLYPLCLRNMSFDNCDIIWKTFRENGYLTAYGEDEPFLNTFNYYKEGFVEPPTKFYLRPYFLSAYLLPMTYKHLMGVCTGPENTAERILRAAKNFLTTFKDDPTFSLFWLNSFSHDDVNFPSSMDDKVHEFFTQDSHVKDALADSIVVVFSDHGFRFGNIRFTYSGWLEERLPFLYFKFPKSFKKSHSKFYENFVFNAHKRLTTPYDFHMTLQHLLKLSHSSYDIKPSLGCSKCKSLFEEVQENRSCSDGGIPQHWCTCEGYNTVSPTDKTALKVGNYLVDYLNRLIKGFPEEGYKCAKYELTSIQAVGKSARKFNQDINETDTFLILIETYPYAMFEATVKDNNGSYELLGDISRLNRYGAYSSCIYNDRLQKYCFCNSWHTRLFSKLCYLFNCPVL